MIVLAVALLLQAAAPATAPVAASPARPQAAAADADGPTAEGLDDLRRAYHDSCEQRIYGEYDDICSAMADQIRRYRVELAKADRRRLR